MLTNRLGLPDAMVRAVANDPYSRGESDISVTQLIAPPYQRRLREANEAQEDAADRMWALLGQATHNVLERAYPLVRRKDISPKTFYARHGFLREERLAAQVGGWVVSGAFDVYERGVLKDYKVTSVWSVMGETKLEWEQQLNMLRYLAHRNDFCVTGLQIIAILRDWQKTKARITAAKEYPQLGVEVINVPVWPLAEAEAFTQERVRLHQSMQPDPCSDKERWKTEDVWAVMKVGRKSAVKLHDTPEAAEEHALELGKGHTVTARPGEYRRCMDYCPVSHVCPQFKSEVIF